MVDMLQNRELYHQIARRLRVRLADCNASHVMVVEGGQGGRWIEVQRDDWYFQISDRDGTWGVTTYTAIPNNAEGTFGYTFDGLRRTAYWLHNREDGPSYKKATTANVMSYLVTVGVLAGVPSVERRLARIEARDSVYLGKIQDLERELRRTGVEHRLVRQHSFAPIFPGYGGGFAFEVEIMADHWNALVDGLRRQEATDPRLGTSNVLPAGDGWRWAEGHRLRWLPLRLFDATEGEAVYEMIAAMRGAGVPFDHYGPIMNRSAGVTKVTLVVPDDKANDLIRYARDLPNGALYVFGEER